MVLALQWHHNERNGVLNQRRPHCLIACLFRRRSKETSKLRVTDLSVVNSPHKEPVTRKMFPFDDVFMVINFTHSVEIKTFFPNPYRSIHRIDNITMYILLDLPGYHQPRDCRKLDVWGYNHRQGMFTITPCMNILIIVCFTKQSKLWLFFVFYVCIII